jgi:basic membrane lipoprotein Med (substrate-binding protein (PBP1-ABC) superfamily)
MGVELEILWAGVPPAEFDDAGFTMIEKGAKLIFVPCLGHGPEVWAIAQAYPDVYCTTGGLGKGDVFPPGTPEEEMVLPDNMCVHDVGWGSTLQQFLTGVAAAHMTTTGKLGFIGGIPYPSVAQILHGWVAGAHYVNSSLDVSQNVWVGDWSDPAKGAEVARAMHEYGVDYIGLSADGTGHGAISYAEREDVEGLYVVGQSWVPIVDKYPETVYAVQDFIPDDIIIAYVEGVRDGDWVEKYGGIYTRIGFVDDVLPGFGPPTLNYDLVPDWVVDEIDDAYDAIVAGEIDMDTLLEEAKALVGPE